MQSARKGLKRVGMRCYEISGPHGIWIIERERSYRFHVRPQGWPRAPGGKGKSQSMFFQAEPFNRLYLARAEAERLAGIVILPRAFDPARDIPRFLLRSR